MTTEIDVEPVECVKPAEVVPQALVRVRDVCHTFGQGESSNKVLKNNNLDLFPGEIVIMTGQSGSGKTTLLTLIGGLRHLQEGSIEVLGQQLAGMSSEDYIRLRRRIGFIFQAHNLFGSLTAVQNVRLALELEDESGGFSKTNAQIQKRAIDLLERLGLKTKTQLKPQQLSGGQRQRVAIARALANEPRLILADEPTAALDAESADIVVKLLKELVATGDKTAIIVTHDTKILETAHRIVNMKYGEIVSNINVPRAKTICKFLKDSRSLRDLIPGTLTEIDLSIADKMVDESFAKDSVIIQAGEIGDKFYMIRNGVVEAQRRLEDGSLHTALMQDGEFFGEVALLRNEKRNATVVAKSDVVLFTLKKQDFEEILRSRTSFEEQVLNVLSGRS